MKVLDLKSISQVWDELNAQIGEYRNQVREEVEGYVKDRGLPEEQVEVIYNYMIHNCRYDLTEEELKIYNVLEKFLKDEEEPVFTDEEVFIPKEETLPDSSEIADTASDGD